MGVRTTVLGIGTLVVSLPDGQLLAPGYVAVGGTVHNTITLYVAPAYVNYGLVMVGSSGTAMATLPSGQLLFSTPPAFGAGTVRTAVALAASGKGGGSGRFATSLSLVVSQHVYPHETAQAFAFNTEHSTAAGAARHSETVAVVRHQGQPLSDHFADGVVILSNSPSVGAGGVAASVQAVASGSAFGGGTFRSSTSVMLSGAISLVGSFKSRAPGANIKKGAAGGMSAGVVLYAYVGGGIYISIGLAEAGGVSTNQNEVATGEYEFTVTP